MVLPSKRNKTRMPVITAAIYQCTRSSSAFVNALVGDVRKEIKDIRIVKEETLSCFLDNVFMYSRGAVK